TLVGWKISGLQPSIPTLDRSFWLECGEIVRSGFPFLSWQITLAVYGGIDRLLLGAMVPVDEVGWYAAAYRIIGMTVFLPTLVVNPLFPALSRSLDEPETLRRTIAQTMRVLLVVMGGLASASIAVAPGIPRLLGWPADFEGAVPLMFVLALHLPVVAVDMVLGVVLMAIHREQRLVFVGLGAVVFNVAANLVCIPLFQQAAGNGAMGSAVVTVLTELFMCAGAVVLIPKHLLDVSVIWVAGRLVLAGLAGIIAGFTALSILGTGLLFLPLALAGAGFAAVLAFAAVAVVLRAVVAADVRSFALRLAHRSAS
ncbi:MAG TPA: polysaccharide biosynthesis C-terminal domain-containing protein, partial [Chloroflexota bacterium]